jgi:hypothetical protein
VKIDREDFPPSVPAEIADRIVALQEVRDRPNWWMLTSIVAMMIAAIVLVVARDFLGWPAWAAGLAMPLVFGTLAAVRLIDGHRFHRVLVDERFTCPKCDGTMFTDTWSLKKQETERNALFAERCPRCFESVSQIVPGTSR